MLASRPRAAEPQLNAAVAAAKAAFPAWSETPIDERKRVVNAIADVIEANGAELAQLLTQEQGKPLADATGEVYGMAAFCRVVITVGGRAIVQLESSARSSLDEEVRPAEVQLR